MQWKLKKRWGLAQLRNFRVRVWSNWALRSKVEAASGVKWEERELSCWVWRLRYVIALSARRASELEQSEESGR